MDCDPDLNPDSGPGARENAANHLWLGNPAQSGHNTMHNNLLRHHV